MVFKQITESNLERYSRQIIMDEVGYGGQLSIMNSSVLIVGCGGLGSAALLYLSMAGVNKICIIDFDTVSLSNLNRQILFNEKDIGEYKVKVAIKKVKEINKNIDILGVNKKLEVNNIKKIFGDYKLILDCTDNFKSRYLINDFCFFNEKILISSAIQGFDIQLFAFKAWDKKEYPCYRCIFPDMEKNMKIGNCNELGIIPPVAGLGGILQANTAIKVILNKNREMFNEFILFNSFNSIYKKLNLKKNKECPLCNKNK